jgi:hypothetical protein
MLAITESGVVPLTGKAEQHDHRTTAASISWLYLSVIYRCRRAGDRRYGGIFGVLFEMWVLAGEGTVKRLEAR